MRWLLGRIFRKFGFKRTEEFVKAQYARSTPQESRDEIVTETVTREFNGRLVQLPSIDTSKFKISYLSRIIRELSLRESGNIRSVLELGSGDGFNLLALRVLHPEIKIWRGIDLASPRVVSATSLLADPPMKRLGYITGFGEEVIRRRLDEGDIKFQEGNMLNAPFPHESFDVVFTCQAIEQIPRDYLLAFQQARRIAAKYACFLEEFLEVQNIFHRMHLATVDYFCASIHEVEKAGFKIIKFEPYPLRTFYFRLGMLVCSCK